MIANGDMNHDLAINQLSEIFRIVRHNLIHDPTNHFTMSNQQNSTFEPFGLDETIQLPESIYFG